MADAEDGGGDLLFGEVFDEEVDFVRTLGAAGDGVALAVFAAAGFGEGFVEFDGGEGGGAFFAVAGEPGGDEALVHEAFGDVFDRVGSFEHFTEKAGLLGVGDVVFIDAVHFAGDLRAGAGLLFLWRGWGALLLSPLFEEGAGAGAGRQDEGCFGVPVFDVAQAADGFGLIDQHPAADGGGAFEFAAETAGGGGVLLHEEPDGGYLERGAGFGIADGGVGADGGVKNRSAFGSGGKEVRRLEEGLYLEDGRLGVGRLFDLLEEGEHQRGDGE